jgi:predicted RNase H-like HicB family nuclease
MQYAVVVEHAPGTNYRAYVPDLTGCVSTGDTLEEVSRNTQEAVKFDLEGMRSDGDLIPEATTRVTYAEVAV